ncbi:hypothetical protein BJX65DRAFT_152874 [Aspergillus insuetus]
MMYIMCVLMSVQLILPGYAEVSSIWLKPAVSTLRYLVLEGDHYFGFFPKLDLPHFPHPDIGARKILLWARLSILMASCSRRISA